MKRGQFLKALAGLPFGVGTFLAQKIRQTEPKPHYLLNKFYVAGFQYYEGPSLIDEMQPGESLVLAADAGNSYDKFAVAVYREDIMLGYVPRTDNKHISRLLQQGMSVGGKIVKTNPARGTWKMLKVHIYL